ncbi:MAG: hypothetical protein PHV20_08540 [Bacteroidales bacterium]|nr:hypothetical protein [Bacteroidales bacterium]
MKKVLFSILFIAFATTAAFSQVQPHAIGLRFGGGDGVGTEISYQHALKSNHRLEADLGFVSSSTFNRMQLTGLYQWVWNIQGAFNWYAGFGAGLGQHSFKNAGSELQFNLNGNIGIEYQLDVPVQFSLDFRPAFGNSQFDNSSMALAARYTF